MPRQKILIVDDDPDIRNLINIYLTKEGYETAIVSSGDEAVTVVKSQRIDLIILDVMLPDIDGFEVCRVIRQEFTMPILFLTVKDEEFDKVLGLSLGADDYLTKPFSPRELVPRVKAILRRANIADNPRATSSSNVICFKQLCIDAAGYQVTVNNRVLNLPAKEFQLLLILAKHPNQVFSREQLYEHIWGVDAAGDSRTVLVHIKNLRQRLAIYPEIASWIKTIWGVGYKFQPDD